MPARKRADRTPPKGDVSAPARARKQRLKEARDLIDIVRMSDAARSQDVVVVVINPMTDDVTGYRNVDPVPAALALIKYLDRNRPRSGTESAARRPRSSRNR